MAVAVAAAVAGESALTLWGVLSQPISHGFAGMPLALDAVIRVQYSGLPAASVQEPTSLV